MLVTPRPTQVLPRARLRAGTWDKPPAGPRLGRMGLEGEVGAGPALWERGEADW